MAQLRLKGDRRYEKPAFSDAAAAIDAAVDRALADSRKRTADLGGPLGTQAFAGVVVEELRSKS
ncbi:hypothetical protein ACFL2E_01860 [Thermodesulfobacteriota bacterium]